MSTEDKSYREAMAEITAILQKYDLAGAVTIVSQERAMFKYHFPSWSCITLEDSGIRLKALKVDFPDKEAQRKVIELSVHIIMQMRDIAAQTFAMGQGVYDALRKTGLEIDHKPFSDFNPEHEH